MKTTLPYNQGQGRWPFTGGAMSQAHYTIAIILLALALAFSILAFGGDRTAYKRDWAHGETACRNHKGLASVERHSKLSDRVLTIICNNGHETYSPYRGE